MTIDLGENPVILFILMILESLLVIIPALITARIEKKSFKKVLSEIGFTNQDTNLLLLIKKVFYGIIIGITLFIIGGFIIFFFTEIVVGNLFGNAFIEEGIESSINTELKNPSLIYSAIFILLQIIIVGPTEEGFFRGFVFKKIETKLGLVVALILSSICFAFFHTPPLIVPISTIVTYFGYYFTIGCLLGLIFIWFDTSLIPCSVAHSLFNILILII